jgi:hypothetical protein
VIYEVKTRSVIWRKYRVEAASPAEARERLEAADAARLKLLVDFDETLETVQDVKGVNTHDRPENPPHQMH